MFCGVTKKNAALITLPHPSSVKGWELSMQCWTQFCTAAKRSNSNQISVESGSFPHEVSKAPYQLGHLYSIHKHTPQDTLHNATPHDNPGLRNTLTKIDFVILRSDLYTYTLVIAQYQAWHNGVDCPTNMKTQIQCEVINTVTSTTWQSQFFSNPKRVALYFLVCAKLCEKNTI